MSRTDASTAPARLRGLPLPRIRSLRLPLRGSGRGPRVPAGFRIGIAVASDGVRVVAVERGIVRWATEVPWAATEHAITSDRPHAETLADAITATLAPALASAPRRVLRGAMLGLTRPVAIAAVGAGAAQLRRLSELPPFTDARLVARAVREGSGRFFLRNGVPLVTTSVQLVEPGSAWAGAVDEPVLAALAAACQRAGLRLRAVVPAPVAIARAVADGEIAWHDGATTMRVTAVGGRVTYVRRVPVRRDAAPVVALGTADLAFPEVGSLASLGTDGRRYADAYGAAILPLSEPLATRPSGTTAERAVPRWRRVLAWSVAGLALVAAVAAPGVSARWHARQAERALLLLGPTTRAMALTERALATTDDGLRAHAAFDARRRSAIGLLEQLTQVLPEGAALVALRMDSVGGTLMALTPRAGALVAALDTLPLLAAVEVLGPVTRERVTLAPSGASEAVMAPGMSPPGTPAVVHAVGTGSVRELERVAVRFRWGRDRTPRTQPVPASAATDNTVGDGMPTASLTEVGR